MKNILIILVVMFTVNVSAQTKKVLPSLDSLPYLNVRLLKTYFDCLDNLNLFFL
jgi:hypothetical protein